MRANLQEWLDIEGKIEQEVNAYLSFLENQLNTSLKQIIKSCNLDLTIEEEAEALIKAREVFFKG